MARKVEKKINNLSDNLKLKSSVNLLIEKLTQLGIDLGEKSIIIKNGELTIE